MLWLADECMSARLVGELRKAGHDVIYVLETTPGADDSAVVALANRHNRVLLTEDKDFGELVIRQQLRLPGLVLMRTASDDYRLAWQRLDAAIERFGDDLLGRYTVIGATRFRSRRLQASWS